jgi:hypothetical protein
MSAQAAMRRHGRACTHVDGGEAARFIARQSCIEGFELRRTRSKIVKMLVQ